MADIHSIQRRIRGVESISKITRAMEMIATSKMRRTQERGLAGRPYAEKIREVLSTISTTSSGEAPHPLLQRRSINNIALVHITPDRGLCGGLVANINRMVSQYTREQEASVSFICIGRKGVDFIRRTRRNVKAEFTGLGDNPGYVDTLPISRLIIDEYTSGEIDAAFLSYTRFISTMHQEPVIQPILPVEPEEAETSAGVNYTYEPDPETVLGELLPRFVEIQIYHAILESIASEQSARMVAMRNATDNAAVLTDDLTLLYNKARQESITTELLDITSGVEAMNG
ncbi:MAG: ATP synthase F1 subunit gamma [Dehalococcoidales bacterium]|nr:ATP synthase F1 subunit gamma [Dehalococcoidales bacterium]